jgi:AcrR family transcriptional regulator
MRKVNSSSIETRELILNAAGRIFAEHGFHATTVRQITQEAGANLAAVNYHFRDKHELYVSVLKRAHQAAANTAEADHPGPARERLRTFIRSFLAYLLDPNRPAWQGSLIAREMAQPTPALDRLIDESIRPVRRRLFGIVREILGARASDDRAGLCCHSIIGQCLHYVHCRETIVRLFPKGSEIPRDVEALTDHIYEFSYSALKAMKNGAGAKSSRRRPIHNRLAL